MGNQLRKLIVVAMAGTWGATAAPAWAQDETKALKDTAVKEAATAKTSTTVPDGWTVKLSIGGSLNVTINNQAANDSGLGQNRANIQLGLVTGFEANLKHGDHGWDNNLTLQLGFTTQFREPASNDPRVNPELDAVTDKTQDQLEYLSTYVYRLKDPDWLGPFVRYRLTTQVLPGDAPNPEFDPTEPDNDDNPSRVDLTDSFSPITMRESAGFFAKPVDNEDFTFDSKLGVGAQQLFGRSGFTFDAGGDGCDKTTESGMFRCPIQDANSAGAEADVAMKGVLRKDFATWVLNVNVFVPVISDAEDDKRTGELERAVGFNYFDLTIQAALSFKISKYLSIDLTGLIRRQPLVVRPVQVQTGILFSTGFEIL